ncbi:hypothetical protein BGZ57DRAFT_855314 [Hyaloscypha finlandica]|nr:hypothetical protein BGZ57DRAFT_855314 [Hyaloscypha finlandica]
MKDCAGDGVGGFAGSLLLTLVKGELSNSSNPASRYCLLKDRATRVDLNGGILELKRGAALGRKLCVWSVPFGRGEGGGVDSGATRDAVGVRIYSKECREEVLHQECRRTGLSRSVFLRWNSCSKAEQSSEQYQDPWTVGALAPWMEVVSRVVWCGGAGQEQHGRGCAARARARATPVPVPEPVPEPVSAHARREGAVDGRRGWHAGVGPWDLGDAAACKRQGASIALRSDDHSVQTPEHANPHSESRPMPPRCPSRVPCARPENLCPVGEGMQRSCKQIRNEQPRSGIRQSPQARSRLSVALSHAIRVCNP